MLGADIEIWKSKMKVLLILTLMKSTAPLGKKVSIDNFFNCLGKARSVILSYFIHSLEIILLMDIRVQKTCVHVKFIISRCVWCIV